jgi:hypothetical protein
MNGTKWLRARGARGVALAFFVSAALLPWLGGASLFEQAEVVARLERERARLEAGVARAAR